MAIEVSKCVIISGAPEDDYSYYTNYINDRYIIAADSGYLKCLKLNILPDLVIGDFDSSNAPEKHIGMDIIKLPERKDDSDTFYCVKKAIELGFKNIVILGALGDRFDHTYSNILSLNYAFENGCHAFIINAHNKISICCGKNIIEKTDYKYFSVFSLFSSAVISIDNADYNVDNYALEPIEQIGQSNKFIDDYFLLDVKKGKVLLIESND